MRDKHVNSKVVSPESASTHLKSCKMLNDNEDKNTGCQKTTKCASWESDFHSDGFLQVYSRISKARTPVEL